MEDAAKVFNYGPWSLLTAVDALMAYDGGFTDSGVFDDGLKRAVKDHLDSLDEDEHRRACAEIARHWLSDGAIEQGYGLEDVILFNDWLQSLNYF